MPDYDAMRVAEMQSISEFLHTLSTADWDHDSLCAGCASALPAHSASPASAIHAA